MITRFWWIRHGPTHAKGMVGWRDIPADLSDVAGLARLEAGFAPPEGESWNGLAARIRGEVDDLIAEHAGQNVIAVAHFAVILTAIQMAGGLEAKQAFRFKIDNLSVTQLDYIHDAKAWRINGINHVL